MNIVYKKLENIQIRKNSLFIIKRIGGKDTYTEKEFDNKGEKYI